MEIIFALPFSQSLTFSTQLGKNIVMQSPTALAIIVGLCWEIAIAVTPK